MRPLIFLRSRLQKKTKMIINRRPHVATASTEGPYEIHSNSFIVIDFCSLCFCNGMPSFIERISIQANQWQLFIIFSKTLRPCGSLVITSIRGRKHNQSTSIWRQKKITFVVIAAIMHTSSSNGISPVGSNQCLSACQLSQRQWQTKIHSILSLIYIISGEMT